MRATDRLVHELGTTRRGLAAFFGLGVADGSFFPVPIEPFVLPVLAAHPARVWIMTAAMLAGCVGGTFLFYLIGFAAEETLVAPLLAVLGLTEEFDVQMDAIRENSFVTLFLIGLTPIPLQIGTLGAGVAGVDPVTFLLAMLLSRGLRYGALALASLAIGISAADLFARYRSRLVLAGVVAVAAGFTLWKMAGF